MSLNKQTKPRRRKAWKIVSIISSVLLILAVVSLPTLLILDSTGTLDLTSGVNRQYTITFKVDDEVFYTKTAFRGAPIDYSDLKDPIKSGSLYKYYTFIGWDLNGDGFSDSLPTRAYKSYVAVAIFESWGKM